jgi:hypothetical protein
VRCLVQVWYDEEHGIKESYPAQVVAAALKMVKYPPLELSPGWLSPCTISTRCARGTDARVKSLIAFFGKDCDVRRLTQEDQIAFARKRLAGRIFLGMLEKGKERLTAPVRQRSAQADIEVLA